MPQTQINGGTQIKTGTITTTQLASAAGITDAQLATPYIKADGTRTLSADWAVGSHKITGLTDPTGPQDAATKAYVDSAAAGIDWKGSVRAATTTAGTLASSFANSSTIDGITLVTGNRILIKNQSSGSENGIYTVNASGAPTRAVDADANAEVTGGLAVFVEEGTTQSDTGWVMTNDGTVTLGSTALVFTQFTGVGALIAGAGLTKTGNTVDIVATNTSLTVNADDIGVNLGDASLEISSGLRVKHSTSPGDVYIGNASNILTPVTLSGDVTSVSGAGAVVLNATTIVKYANVITRETPSGTINGSNTAFTLANTPVAGTEEVYLNGLLQEPGAGNDYTIATNAITYLTAPLTGDRLRVNYRK